MCMHVQVCKDPYTDTLGDTLEATGRVKVCTLLLSSGSLPDLPKRKWQQCRIMQGKQLNLRSETHYALQPCQLTMRSWLTPQCCLHCHSEYHEEQQSELELASGRRERWGLAASVQEQHHPPTAYNIMFCTADTWGIPVFHFPAR